MLETLSIIYTLNTSSIFLILIPIPKHPLSWIYLGKYFPPQAREIYRLIFVQDRTFAPGWTNFGEKFPSIVVHNTLIRFFFVWDLQHRRLALCFLAFWICVDFVMSDWWMGFAISNHPLDVFYFLGSREWWGRCKKCCACFFFFLFFSAFIIEIRGRYIGINVNWGSVLFCRVCMLCIYICGYIQANPYGKKRTICRKSNLVCEKTWWIDDVAREN